MTKVLLDVATDSHDFAKLIRRLNKSLGMTFLCGQQHWNGKWDGQPFPNKIRQVTGGFRSIDVPDESLDIITLNANPQLDAAGNKHFSKQVLRCLKKDGYLISTQVGLIPAVTMDKNFRPVLQGQHFVPENNLPVCILALGDVTIRYPASSTVRRVMGMVAATAPIRQIRDSNDIPCPSTMPTVTVWERIK